MPCRFSSIGFHVDIADSVMWNCSLYGKALTISMLARNPRNGVIAYVIQQLSFIEQIGTDCAKSRIAMSENTIANLTAAKNFTIADNVRYKYFARYRI